jgi:hypothetical protein
MSDIALPAYATTTVAGEWPWRQRDEKTDTMRRSWREIGRGAGEEMGRAFCR